MHYSILVVLREGEDLDQVMEPFGCEHEVDEYDEQCWCVGEKAREDVGKKLPFMAVREAYNKLPEAEQTNILWRKMISEHHEAERKLLEAHPDIDKPRKSCSECRGTGTYKSTSNPNSHWDYYTEGGRWDGGLTNKKGKSVNKLKVKNLSLEQMELAAHRELVEQWDKIQEAIKEAEAKGKPITPNYAHFALGYDGEKDFQTFAAKRKPDSVSAYAYVVDGEWKAHEEFNRRLHQSISVPNWQEGLNEVIKKSDPDDTLTMIDCHN